MIDWLIIGGGIHGTHLALYLNQRRAVPLERIRILDPQPALLALWEHHGRNVGMEYLRSAHAHNLSYDPFSLATFARTQAGAPYAKFLEPYGRPSWELFQAHNRFLLERYQLTGLHTPGRAQALTPTRDGWRIETDEGLLEARNVVLAIGNTEQPLWPDWARQLHTLGAPINHIFDADLDRAALPAWKHAVVVGGGITAVQTALALAMQYPNRKLTLLMRHPVRIAQFDADPGWVSLYTAEFRAIQDYLRRREVILQARNHGSLPLDVSRDLQTALVNNLLVRRMEEVVGATYLAPQPEPPRSPEVAALGHPAGSRPPSRPLGPGLTSREDFKRRTQELTLPTHFEPPTLPKAPMSDIHLRLASRDAITTDRLILATGFEPVRPGGEWLTQTIQACQLPVALDGFPIVDSNLRWAEGLFVMGPLAELEVGPVARNIIGARLASERIGATVD